MFKLVVLSTLVALAASNPSVVGPWGLAGLGPLGLGAPLGLAGPLGLGLAGPLGLGVPGVGVHGFGVHGLGLGGLGVAPAIHAYNYRGPLSLAPGQPANILAADGRPLDTLSVNLDRAAHITAKAVSGAHLLKKRSAPLLAPLAVSHAARIDYPGRLIAPAPLGLAGPGHLGLAGLGPVGLPIGPLGPLGPLGWGNLGLGVGHGIW